MAWAPLNPMQYILAIPAGLLLFISIVNFFSIRTPWQSSIIEESISVLIPLRNESENIEQLVASLHNQVNLTKVEFLLLDDNSDDQTLSLLNQHCAGKENFKVLSGSELASGWIGKVWALQQLYENSTGDIIVSVDADVRLDREAISKAVTLIKATGLDFLSPYPKQLANTWSEKLIQPLLQWSWMSTLVLRIAEKSSRPSMVVANGQFFLVRRKALEEIGGYKNVAHDVLDDIELGRELVRHGFHGCVADGSRIATTHMYSSWKEIQAGYGKSLHCAFGSLFGALFAIIFIFLTGVAPLISGLTGSLIGWYAYAALCLTRTLSAIKVGKSGLDAFLHPISSLLLIYLIVYSWVMRGEIKWKGRTV